MRKDSIFNKKYQKIYCMKKISFQLKRMHSSDTLVLGEYSGKKKNKRADRGEPALLYCGTSPIGQTMESVYCLSADKYIRKMWHGQIRECVTDENMKVIVMCLIAYYHITQEAFQLQHKTVKSNLLCCGRSTLIHHAWFPAFYFKVIGRAREHIENKVDKF